MLPLIERTCVSEKGWLSNEDMAALPAVAESVRRTGERERIPGRKKPVDADGLLHGPRLQGSTGGAVSARGRGDHVLLPDQEQA